MSMKMLGIGKALRVEPSRSYKPNRQDTTKEGTRSTSNSVVRDRRVAASRQNFSGRK